MAQIIKKRFIQIEEASAVSDPIETLKPLINEEEAARIEKERYEKGYTKGKEEANQEFSELKERLTQLLETIPSAIKQNRLEMKEELTSLCLMIVQSYFIAQSVETQVLANHIDQLLAQINNQQTIELHLNTQDIKLLQQGTIQLPGVKHELTVKPSDNLALGGFIIKTPQGLFEFNIEKQIDKLKNYLLKLKEEQSS